MLLIIYTSSAIFVYPLLKSFDRKNRICKQFPLTLLVRKFLLLESFQRFSRDMLSNHKKDKKSAKILSTSAIVIPHSCFLGIFSFNHKTKSCKNDKYFWRWMAVIVYSTAVTQTAIFHMCGANICRWHQLPLLLKLE